MQQKWWLVAAGVIGIGLAVLLFPRPDTGGDVPAADPRNTDPLDFKSGDRPRVIARGVPGPDGKIDPRGVRRDVRSPEDRLGPNPVAADLAKRRGTPEAIHAGRASGPWTVVRRQLMLMNDEEGTSAFSAEVEAVVLALRNLRREPEGGDYAALEAQQKDLIARIRANEAWMSDPVIVASVDRLDGILAEYHEDVAGADEAGDEPQE